MQSITLILESEVELRQIAECFARQPRLDIQSDIRFVVEGSWGWCCFTLDDNGVRDFEETELAKIRETIARPAFWMVEFSDATAADFAVVSLADLPKAMIDNDNGLLTAIEDIRLRIAKGDPWLQAAN